MSGIFLDKSGGRLALYLNGDLQFDSADEALYHRPLAALPVELAAGRFPSRGLRVLVLGGGDGLALREALASPRVAEARLVERDRRVLKLGAGELAGLNRGSLGDPRVRIQEADAREVLPSARGWDVLIYDLTYPSDPGGAELFSVARFEQARRALRPGGILALNAVSPEKTPQAYACIGATLEAAGLRALPYALRLPSFEREGYGRWGFFFASTRPLPEGAFPEEALLFPPGFDGRSAPNRNGELLQQLRGARPLAWGGPWTRPRFSPLRRSGPAPAAARGFSAWLADPGGRRTLEGLLGCLPLPERERTREELLEWTHQAQTLWREVDLGAFLDQALARAKDLPKGWGRELRRLKARIKEGAPDLREVLEQSYRVFAILLIVLLLANMFFPDNLFAKGFSSHYGGGGGSFDGFSFSRSYSSPYRSHYYSGNSWRSGRTGQVLDSNGKPYPVQKFSFTDKDGGRKPATGLLALSPEMQLLESGAIAYKGGPPAYRFLLEPRRLRVLTLEGRDVVSLLPSAALVSDVRKRVAGQGPVLDRAMEEHRRWLEWVSYAPFLSEVRDARSEMEGLKTLRSALANAETLWRDAPVPPAPDLPAQGFSEIFPGVWLETVYGDAARPPRVCLVGDDGVLRARSLAAPARLGDEDRFLFNLLQKRLSQGDPRLGAPLAAWIRAHGAALGVGGGGTF